MKRCIKCSLPEAYIGISFDEKGVCNYCNYFSATKGMRRALRGKLKKHFFSIIEKIKKKPGDYDCLVCYSGGKDSTYLLLELKEKFDLNILAYTLNNGFISKRALENIREITERLDVDHIMFKPRQGVLNEVFSAALTSKIAYPKELISMLSPLCAICQGMILGFAVNLAMDKDIPAVFVGFTPGQYPDVSYENFLKSDSCIYFTNSVNKDDPPDIIKMIKDPIDEVCGEKAERYFLKSQYLEKDRHYPHILFPFQTVFEYDESTIYKKIKSKGWKHPRDTDACSTNCLINTLSNYVFAKRYGFHPYAAEISTLIREGHLPYSSIKELEKVNIDSKAMKYSLEKLGLSTKDINA